MYTAVFQIEKTTSLTHFLMGFYPSKSTLSKWLTKCSFTCNELPIGPTDICPKDSLLTITYSNIVSLGDPYPRTIPILYEDQDIIVADKPTSILVHSDGVQKNTIQNILVHYAKKHEIPFVPLVVHRLDVDTSGIILFAKHPFAQTHLDYQFRNRLVHKTYVALVNGIVSPPRGSISQPIGRNRHDSSKYIVSQSGSTATTHYETLRLFTNHTLLRVNPVTGRPHQIRVHLSFIGHPIIGDSLYGTEGNRLYLHAKELQFLKPYTNKAITIHSRLPKGFETLCKQL